MKKKRSVDGEKIGLASAMGSSRRPLYEADEARSLQEREGFIKKENQLKFPLLLENLGPCRCLVDIGCGWGEFLGLAQDRVPELWGVDESPDRIEDVKRSCPKAKIVICGADKLALPDAYFDVAVTSQMLHEVKLFGEKGELARVLREIRRILAKGGRYLLLDHLDAGEGEVVARLPDEKMEQLAEFEQKFKFYPARHERVEANVIRTSRHCLQDFLTKTWSLNTPMESMEMNETHNVFQKKEAFHLIESSGFMVRDWIVFSDIRDELKAAGGDLVEGQVWNRKFLLVAVVEG
ncbi:MAG: class I SAM-dependent methyltransferase [Candidatus Zixiibacteriota bacterium]